MLINGKLNDDDDIVVDADDADDVDLNGVNKSQFQFQWCL